MPTSTPKPEPSSGKQMIYDSGGSTLPAAVATQNQHAQAAQAHLAQATGQPQGGSARNARNG